MERKNVLRSNFFMQADHLLFAYIPLTFRHSGANHFALEFPDDRKVTTAAYVPVVDQSTQKETS
jgi:hypothetical protein